MSRIAVAKGRFLSALEGLENAVGGVGETLDAAARQAEKLALAEAEQERLKARLAELEEEIAALSTPSISLHPIWHLWKIRIPAET